MCPVERLVVLDILYQPVFDVDYFARFVGYSLLVRNDDGSDAGLVKFSEQLHYLFGGLAVKRTGRFVGKQNFGLRYDGAVQ